MTLKYLLVITLFFVLPACTGKQQKDNYITIDVQPFEGVDNSRVAYVLDELVKIYPHIKIMKAIQLPAKINK